MSRNMATKEQIKALKIDENVWNWKRILNRTSNVSKGEPTTSWTAPIFIIWTRNCYHYNLGPRFFFFFCIRLLNSSSAGSLTGLFVSNSYRMTVRCCVLFKNSLLSRLLVSVDWLMTDSLPLLNIRQFLVQLGIRELSAISLIEPSNTPSEVSTVALSLPVTYWTQPRKDAPFTILLSCCLSFLLFLTIVVHA